MRAREAGAVVVLGSATPSLESWANAHSGKYRLLSLPARVGGGVAPARRGRGSAHEHARGATSRAAERQVRGVLSEPLEPALGDTLARGEQSILLLNRRGYASFVQCSACEWVATCPHCSITLTYHRTPERLVCHYCQHQEPTTEPARMRRALRCGSAVWARSRWSDSSSERFPAARIARMDVDTTSGKWAHAEILDRVGRGEVDILLGTQMIAKGLDFPNVTLVGVIDADVGINLPDFRASERTFQLLSQVAGRAGRGPKGGLVFIQTRVPGAPRRALRGDARLRGVRRARSWPGARTRPIRHGPAGEHRVERRGRGRDGRVRARGRGVVRAGAGRRYLTERSHDRPRAVPGGAHQTAMALALAASDREAGPPDAAGAAIPHDVRRSFPWRPPGDV